MKYFNYLSDQDKKQLFYKEPQSFTKSEHKDKLAYSLGATLYMPGIRDRIGEDIVHGRIKELMSVIICLEDAIEDTLVDVGIKNVVSQLNQIDEAVQKGHVKADNLPLIFIRIRNLDQIKGLTSALEEKIKLLTGFVIPKFSYRNGDAYFREIEAINQVFGTSLYLMPVIETKEILYLESRTQNLIRLKELFDQYKHLILNLRIGATDFSSLFGIRRNVSNTIYDISVIRDCLTGILNTFGRQEDGYVISGPVWEYFAKNMGEEELEHNPSIRGLINEGKLDKENGFTGKTVIHPSQIKPIQSLQVVTYEEYMDALDIVNSEKGNNGAIGSIYKNKMNEVKPHLNWARKIIKKSEIYGVYNENKCYRDLLARK